MTFRAPPPASPPARFLIPPGPLDLGAVLGGSLKILGRRFGLFALFAFLPSVAAAVVIVAMSVSVGFLLAQSDRIGWTPTAEGFVGVSLCVLVVVVATAFINIKCQGMMCLAAHDLAHGGSPDFAASWSRTRGLVSRVMWLVLLSTVVYTVIVAGIIVLSVILIDDGSRGSASSSGAGALLAFVFVLPFYVLAIIVMVRLLYFLPVLAIEGAGVWGALSRSWSLTKGKFWRTLGYYLVANTIASSVVLALTILGQLLMMPIIAASIAAGGDDPSSTVMTLITLPSLLVSSLMQVLMALLVTPFTSIYTTLMYIDQVRRTEMTYPAVPSWAPPPPQWRQSPPPR